MQQPLQCTVCFLIDDNRVCLGMKKRGFGKGFWNGAGGKVESGETRDASMVREIAEEFEIDVDESDLEYRGLLEFSFDDTSVGEIHGHVYVVKRWTGEPTETDEMRPQWFHIDDVPLDDMWEDDKHWLPHVLHGKTIEQARFRFDENQKMREIIALHLK